MSTFWRKLSGDTLRFAVELELHRDPDGGKGASPELSASWGAIKLWVKGRNILAHSTNGERIDGVHWYLWPILEWMVDEWNPLWHEEHAYKPIEEKDRRYNLAQLLARPPEFSDLGADDQRTADRYEWWKRHSMLSCREGGIFPEIVFRRLRSKVEISWADSRLPGIPDDLIFDVPWGEEVFDPVEVAGPWWDVTTDALREIGKRCTSDKVSKLLSRAEGLKDTDARERRIPWLAGLGKIQNEVVEGWNSVKKYFKDAKGFLEFDQKDLDPLVINGSCQASLLFGSCSPSVTESDLAELAPLLLKIWNDRRPSIKYDDFLTAFTPVNSGRDKSPWDDAADLAFNFREYLHWDENDIKKDWPDLLREWGFYLDEISLSDPQIRAISIVSDEHLPAILINTNNRFNNNPKARHFTLLHELCHLLFDREKGVRFAIASGPWAPRKLEQRANAFAAEMLMPPSVLKGLIKSNNINTFSLNNVSELAYSLDVSITALLGRLQHLQIIDDETKESLSLELESVCH